MIDFSGVVILSQPSNWNVLDFNNSTRADISCIKKLLHIIMSIIIILFTAHWTCSANIREVGKLERQIC